MATSNHGTWFDSLHREWKLYLWTAVFALWFVGDLITTMVGLQFFGLAETNTIAVSVMEMFGLWALIPFKILSVILILALFKIFPRPYAYAVPIETAIFSFYIVASNTAYIVGAL